MTRLVILVVVIVIGAVLGYSIGNFVITGLF